MINTVEQAETDIQLLAEFARLAASDAPDYEARRCDTSRTNVNQRLGRRVQPESTASFHQRGHSQ